MNYKIDFGRNSEKCQSYDPCLRKSASLMNKDKYLENELRCKFLVVSISCYRVCSPPASKLRLLMSIHIILYCSTKV